MAARRRKNVHSVDTRSLRAAAALLRRGDLVAFPTETVYGLGANALDAKAVAKIFEAKGRPQDNPVIVHVSDLRMLRKVADPPPPRARALIARFWPGPLTLLLSKKSSLPSSVTAGLDTVAVRMPQGLARDLIRLAGVPVAAPSANLSGRPSPTTALHVAEDFPDVFVLDGGSTKHGVESTVVALEPFPVVLRQGALSEESLRKTIPGLRHAASTGRLASGGGPFSSEVEGARREPRHEVHTLRADAPPDPLSKKIFPARLREGAPEGARPLPDASSSPLSETKNSCSGFLPDGIPAGVVRRAAHARARERAAGPRGSSARAWPDDHGPPRTGRNADRLKAVAAFVRSCPTPPWPQIGRAHV